MKPIKLVLSDLLFLLLCCGPAAESRPNIVFVLADDLGWGDVGWNNPAMADVTPHLTKLAKSGMVLSQYYVQQVLVSIARRKTRTTIKHIVKTLILNRRCAPRAAQPC